MVLIEKKQHGYSSMGALHAAYAWEKINCGTRLAIKNMNLYAHVSLGGVKVEMVSLIAS